jgi:hypothetical protein
MTDPEPRFEYEPSPAHKDPVSQGETPGWFPSKEKCPSDMTAREREEMLRQSYSADGRPDTPRRYAVRRTSSALEFYECKLTRYKPDGTIVVHGHPTRRVPPTVLRKMRDGQQITEAEYRRLRRELS